MGEEDPVAAAASPAATSGSGSSGAEERPGAHRKRVALSIVVVSLVVIALGALLTYERRVETRSATVEAACAPDQFMVNVVGPLRTSPSDPWPHRPEEAPAWTRAIVDPLPLDDGAVVPGAVIAVRQAHLWGGDQWFIVADDGRRWPVELGEFAHVSCDLAW